MTPTVAQNKGSSQLHSTASHSATMLIATTA